MSLSKEDLLRAAEFIEAHGGTKALDALASRLRAAAEGQVMVPREPTMIAAYCAANDYINALLNPSVPKESLAKIADNYWQRVREVK